jgi:uncharacterized protein (DUF427 family)
MSREKKIPDASHPITVEPTEGHVRVLVGGTVIAESDASLTLREASYPPVQYVPLADIDASVLSRTETSTYCPFKGDASYYTVTTADGSVVDAGWTYDEPYDAVAPIATHVAFWPNRAEVLVDEPAVG